MTLTSLGERHLVGIVTAAGRNIVERQLHALGIDAASLAVLQTAEDTPHHKPDPRVFEPALAKLAQRGVPPASVTYVGDSLNDYRAARDAGLQFLGILRGTTTEQAFHDAGARTIDSLAELLTS
ncbi:MAG: HAD family hydrolase [Polyangiaceae bacterium]